MSFRRVGTLLTIALIGGGVLGAAVPLTLEVVQAPHTLIRSVAVGAPRVYAQATNPPAAAPAAAQQPNWVWQKVNELLGWLLSKIASLFAWLMGAAALILDVAVYYTVVKMGSFIQNVSGVGVAWRILRDIGNIALIFGFVISGIMVILDTNKYGYGSKMLPMLLVAAVFLNFSLLVSEVIVDAGNLFATEIFTQIYGGNLPGPPKFGGNSPVVNEGISDRVMAVLGLQSIYNADANNIQNGSSNTASVPTVAGNVNISNSPLIGFMSIILFTVGAFVFFSLAFVLVARFVMLILVMIASPLGFAGLIVPGLNGIAKQWWNQLIDNTITAPVLMLLLYIALAVITDAAFIPCLSQMGGSGTTSACAPAAGTSSTSAATNAWTGFLTGSANFSNFAGILLVFVIAMALLLTVVIAAKSMGAFGARWATQMGGRFSFGAVAWGGRLTVGSLGVMGASKRMQALATPRKGEGWAKRTMRYSLRPVVFTSRGLRGGTYDIRNSALGGALGGYGIDAGKGSKLTAQQVQDARRKYQPGMFGLKEGQFWKESRAEYEAAAREADAKKNLQNAVERNDDDLAQRTLGRMTTKELEDLDAIKAGVEVLVRNLSPEQFENLMKSDKITETQKEAMKEGRYKTLNAAITSSDSKAVGTWTSKDLAIAAPGLLANPATAAAFAGIISDKQYEDLSKNDRLTRGEQQKLRTERDAALLAKFTDTGTYIDPSTSARVPSYARPGTYMTNAEFAMSNLSSTARGKLAANILTEPPPATAPPGTPPTARTDVLELFDAADFRALSRNESLSRAQRDAIGTYLKNVMITPLTPGTPAYNRQSQIAALTRTPAVKSYFNLT